MKNASLAGLTALALACTQAGLAAPPDADTVLPLTLAGSGPYYVLDIDAQARRLSASPGLVDLRVRNGAGETMAFAWVETTTPPPAPQQVSARLYKVPLPPSDDASANSAGTSPRQAWIVDTKDGNDDLLRLDLGLEPGTQGVYTLRVEASDDLQHWRTLLEDAQLVQLQALPQVGATGALATLADREHLSANGIDLDHVPARYLRLTTARRSAIPPLVSASVTRVPHGPAPAPLEWSAAIVASGCEESSCDYPLPRNTPVAAVQVLPAEVDTNAQVMVLGQVDTRRQPMLRHSLLRGSLHALRLKAEHSVETTGMAWESAAVANVYWLSQPSGAPDLHSPPLRLDDTTWQALRLETFGPITQLGHAAPTIRIGVHQRQLVFVARGAGPFALVRAKTGESGAPMSLDALMPGRAADAALPAASASVTPFAAAAAVPSTASASAPLPAPLASRSPWLWAALLAGVATMGAMAWSLLRKPAAPRASDGA